MKKLFIGFACLLPLVACNQRPLDEPVAKKSMIEVYINGSVATKATGIASNDASTDKKVNTLQIIVFNGDAVDGYNSVAATNTNPVVNSCTVTCTAGDRDIYAVVNGPNLSGVTSKAAMLATSVDLVENVSNFVMVGHKSATVGASGTVDIDVERLASRIVVHAVKNAHSTAALADNFKLVSIYITNVCGDVDLGLSNSYNVSKFYNRRGYESANNLGSFTYDEINSNIASGATNSTAHYFYCMPNRYDTAVGGTWTPRRTKIVVRVELAGVLYDYPIAINEPLVNNKSYEITLLTITKNGNPDDGNHDYNDPDDIDEEKPVEGFDKTFTIDVLDWDVVRLGDEGNVSI